MVSRALGGLDLAATDLVLIENVGNLVCPAEFDLGEAAKIALVSVTEGDDKPLKYPALFRGATAFVINKTDLLPYTDCDIARLRGAATEINPQLEVFEVSCRTGEGLPLWFEWLARSARQALETND
jgi:hydrogenase nickel incorporation protein HypB